MKRDEFIEKLHYAAKCKTLYVKGCFGAPLSDKNKKRYIQNNSYNVIHQNDIMNSDVNTFGFDCVCLIKGILWGWSGDKNKTYGGANYGSNGVKDVNADGIMAYCDYVTDDFSKIEEGNIVWMPGHVGIYVGFGRVIECTPKWDNCVQYSLLGNIGNTGNKSRTWRKHGKLKWVEYSSNRIESDEEWYTVQKGDYLTKIAKVYGVSWLSIANLNGIKAPYIVHPGQRIRIK